MSEREFPADDVLIQRGKYSTLGAEKRTHLRLLRDDMETLADCARAILKAAQGENVTMFVSGFVPTELHMAEERFRAAKLRLAALAELEPQLAELKPKAWPKKGNDDE